MKEKRILFLLHIPPPVHGSSVVGQYILESRIINSSFNCRYINLGTSNSIDEIGKKPLRKISRYLYILWQILVNLIYFKPQLCYIAISTKRTAFYKDSIISLLIKLFRVKLVYHLHNKGVSTMHHKLIDNFMYNLVFKNTDVILLSWHLYYDIEKYVQKKRIRICPNGIPDFRITPQKAERVLNENSVEILFLSNLIESKGVFLLLEACSILKKNKINFHCTYVGGEGDVSALQFHKKLVYYGLTDQVDYIGKKYGREKQEIFSKADIFAFPTFYHNECLPLVLLEAMQYCTPVVSTFEGGIRSIVKDGVTGYLVPQKDVHALAEKLRILIQNPILRQKLGMAGRRKYEEEFTLRIFEEQMREILNNITNE